MIRLRALLIFCTVIIGVIGCGKDAPIDACVADKPPEGARKIETRAIDFLVYPAHIPDKYSGCGKIWSEDGYLLFFIKFADGIVRYVEVHDPDNERNGVIKCEIDAQKKLLSGPAEQCSGFENYPMWHEPQR